MVGYGPDNRIRSSQSIFMFGRVTDDVLAAAMYYVDHDSKYLNSH